MGVVTDGLNSNVDLQGGCELAGSFSNKNWVEKEIKKYEELIQSQISIIVSFVHHLPEQCVHCALHSMHQEHDNILQFQVNLIKSEQQHQLNIFLYMTDIYWNNHKNFVLFWMRYAIKSHLDSHYFLMERASRKLGPINEQT